MMSRTTRHSRFASSGRIDRFAIYGFFRLMQTPGEQLPSKNATATRTSPPPMRSSNPFPMPRPSSNPASPSNNSMPSPMPKATSTPPAQSMPPATNCSEPSGTSRHTPPRNAPLAHSIALPTPPRGSSDPPAHRRAGSTRHRLHSRIDTPPPHLPSYPSSMHPLGLHSTPRTPTRFTSSRRPAFRLIFVLENAGSRARCPK